SSAELFARPGWKRAPKAYRAAECRRSHGTFFYRWTNSFLYRAIACFVPLPGPINQGRNTTSLHQRAVIVEAQMRHHPQLDPMSQLASQKSCSVFQHFNGSVSGGLIFKISRIQN